MTLQTQEHSLATHLQNVEASVAISTGISRITTFILYISNEEKIWESGFQKGQPPFLGSCQGMYLSYHNRYTILFTVDPYYGTSNLNLKP